MSSVHEEAIGVALLNVLSLADALEGAVADTSASPEKLRGRAELAVPMLRNLVDHVERMQTEVVELRSGGAS